MRRLDIYPRHTESRTQLDRKFCCASSALTRSSTRRAAKMRIARLTRMMNYVRRGDTVIVESISRLRDARPADLVERLTEKQVEFVSRKGALSALPFSTGKVYTSRVRGGRGASEREYLSQRQREGITLSLKSSKVHRPQANASSVWTISSEWLPPLAGRERLRQPRPCDRQTEGKQYYTAGAPRLSALNASNP